jgi:hypothetical protein
MTIKSSSSEPKLDEADDLILHFQNVDDSTTFVAFCGWSSGRGNGDPPFDFCRSKLHYWSCTRVATTWTKSAESRCLPVALPGDGASASNRLMDR